MHHETEELQQSYHHTNEQTERWRRYVRNITTRHVRRLRGELWRGMTSYDVIWSLFLNVAIDVLRSVSDHVWCE